MAADRPPGRRQEMSASYLHLRAGRIGDLVAKPGEEIRNRDRVREAGAAVRAIAPAPFDCLGAHPCGEPRCVSEGASVGKEALTS